MSNPPPPRPMNAYFKFRVEAINSLKEQGIKENRNERAKQLWDAVPLEEKEKLNQKYLSEMEKWKEAYSKWKD